MTQNDAPKKRILSVDDDQIIGRAVNWVLGKDYDITTVLNGEDALNKILDDGPFDLILLDVVMEELSGYDLCRILKKNPKTADIPIVFLTTKSDPDEEKYGLELGAADYISKPISPAILKARVKTQIQLKSALDRLKNTNQVLAERVSERTQELSLTQEATILSLATLVETRDLETGNHIRRTQHYVRALAEKLAEDSPYARQINETLIDTLYKSAPLHDIGKVGVPDSILLKPSHLSEDEFKIIQNHTVYGRNALQQAESILGSTSFLQVAKEIAYSHHEKWNGTGYPEGLSGEDIPLSARLMALADVYDALISKRIYKDAYSHQKAVGIILEGKGTHFDPVVVEAFLELTDTFREITERFADDEGSGGAFSSRAENVAQSQTGKGGQTKGDDRVVAFAPKSTADKTS